MKIVKDRMTVCDTKDRLIETEQGITCGCGSPKMRMVLHIDGTDFYTYQYGCTCGNSISMRGER